MLRATFSGSSSIGVFARATDNVVLVRADLEDDLVDSIGVELAAPAIGITIAGSMTVGALTVGNSHGLVTSERILDHELETLQEFLEVPITVLPDRINAVGNVILANDFGAYAHPELSEQACSVLRDTLDVPVEKGDIAGIPTVGTAAISTNHGVLCHPKAPTGEMEFLEDLLSVPVDIGTINYGNPLVGSGLVANESGYLAGQETTGAELGRIEEALGYI